MLECWLRQDKFYHHKLWQNSNKVLQAICHILSHRRGRAMLPARGLLSSSDLLHCLHLFVLWRHGYWVCKQADHRWEEITEPSPGFCLRLAGLRKPIVLQSNLMATSAQEGATINLRVKTGTRLESLERTAEGSCWKLPKAGVVCLTAWLEVTRGEGKQLCTSGMGLPSSVVLRHANHLWKHSPQS